ncbi:MAG: hypothetical protein A2079_02480 [Geobacteraceae bacterium GWC2_48_7]|nr:MAG: hypothetical protein A2079_02480 [Geobacteraceae bacterium GWC2_48_7]
MRLLPDNKGFALVTSLMLTLLTLTIVMSLLYMITQSTKISGTSKKYKTALEASYGGAEILTKEILPFVLRNYDSSLIASDLQDSFSQVSLQVTSASCLRAKLSSKTSSWEGCSTGSDPKASPDITYTMQASSGNPFTVYSKIVDTVSGNTDVSGLQLEGAGVAESQSVLTPQHFPYIYKVEIQGERQTNSTAKANIEVLYAY